MKLQMKLTVEEHRTLREMGIHHPNARARMRAQGVLLLVQRCTLQQVADEFGVHINSVEHWRQRWDDLGLVGLFEGHRSGRAPKLPEHEQRQLRELAKATGGTAGTIRRRWEQLGHPHVSIDTIKRYLKKSRLRYKRCRLGLKGKRDEAAFERATGVIASLRAMAKTGQCQVLYFDESGFSPNPPVQYSWTPIGQTRCAEAGVHKERVNVLGALDVNASLYWRIVEKRTVRDDVIAFLDDIASKRHPAPCIVVLDNANIHRGAPMEQKRLEWQQQGLYLYYLPPYCPELNAIEILWKQAKYFWREFKRLTAEALVDEVSSIMKNYGKEFTIKFA
jgi:transposase